MGTTFGLAFTTLTNQAPLSSLQPATGLFLTISIRCVPISPNRYFALFAPPCHSSQGDVPFSCPGAILAKEVGLEGRIQPLHVVVRQS